MHCGGVWGSLCGVPGLGFEKVGCELEKAHGLYEAGYILLLLVSVYKVPFKFLILVSVCTGWPFGGTRDIYIYIPYLHMGW